MRRPVKKDTSQLFENSRWPRRLLHVPSMTSYPWQPGNNYGTHKEPKYNAISYTWGRFYVRNTEPEYASTPYLQVKGVPWNIPRMRPSQFTADEFHQLVINAANPPAEDGFEPVVFVWLDVACIDQTKPHTEDYYKEVGRQARIFEGASEVIVWLTTFRRAEIKEWWSGLRNIERPVIGVEVGAHQSPDLDAWTEHVQTHLRRLRADPWFSSLWTLQEAFLSPRAILMYRDGTHRDLFAFQSATHVQSGTLKDFIYRWHAILLKLRNIRIGHTYQGVKVDMEKVNALEADINNLGLLEAMRLDAQIFKALELPTASKSRALRMGNPLALLKASHQRQCYEITDRVRGIMQVFDMQLGESSPNAIPGKKYSLSELEDQLGAQLLRRYPISSQLMVQSRSCQPRKAWRVSPEMSLTDEAHLFWRQKMDSDTSMDAEKKMITRSGGARLYATTFEDTVMVRFDGKYTTLETFYLVTQNVVGTTRTALRLNQGLHEEFRSAMTKPFDQITIADEFQWLHRSRKGRNIGILFLARIQPPSKSSRAKGQIWCDWGIGLVLCQEKGRNDVYERLGVIKWDVWEIKDLIKARKMKLQATRKVSDPLSYLQTCDGPGWTKINGHFG
ncbi:hypothetical protein TGAM01_v203388 [Trichoderma gamsii]|uniref:Heterokaryon incompatibility domain-containing protein n=1 Tax=Trichoderma gamsii TaxID=398673 RepID=A0A2P4ZTN3_9HYPO|nr:hypothetical protein TGAM01_v203388 [Trichoderma gamsii]PON27621.1 hypothetical protein TGAM01_v203388 [Trichoderma gamsii]